MISYQFITDQFISYQFINCQFISYINYQFFQ